MAKDKTGAALRDPHINVEKADELRDWASKMGTTPDKLRDVVRQVGDRASAVRDHLAGGKPR